MFEQAFKNIDDVLRKEAGCTTELDYTEQTSWLLFLKYLDALEQDRALEAELEGKRYAHILDEPYRWESWAAPKGSDGRLDHNNSLTGDDLRDFVNLKLFPYLQGFKQRAAGPKTLEYKVGEIFGEIKNKISSGYNLREIIEHIDALRFRSQNEKHELSHLYEAKIKNMGNAGRNGGEYYTPRPLIRAIIEVVRPRLKDRIYDGACGSAGFLCESFDYLKRENPKRSVAQDKTLQTDTFYGKEKKPLAYVIGIMNMILHGIDAPNIVHTNTLTENLSDIQEKDRFEVVLANPPFGGSERREVQQNFPIRTSETAFLFLQHFIKMLKSGGRGGVVIKNTFLSNTDNASVGLRKMLLEDCNLHTILDCPSGTFQGAGVKTVVLFFDKGSPTRRVWYYQLNPGRNLGKTNPLNDADLAEFVTLQKTFADSPKSWSVNIKKDVDPTTFDLTVKNPSRSEVATHRSPEETLAEIATLDAESAEVMQVIREMQSVFSSQRGWETKKLGEVCEIIMGQSPDGETYNTTGEGMPLINGPVEFSPGSFGKTLRSKFTTSPTKLCKKGDLILCVRGSTTGKMNIADFDACIGRGVAAIRAKEYQPWINHFISAKRDEIYKLGTGATFPNVSGTMLSNLELALPPLSEQKRIVKILDSLQTQTQRLESVYRRKLAALEELKKSLLHKAFTGEL
ncbi:MAG TPA: N-6 DNA methylase [Pyrinomonadaceae bacterium]|jgi:type I restriction enzyme M protein